MMEYIIAIIGLCVVNALTCVVYHFERKDLYNRIMCENFTEYRRNVQKEQNKTPIDAHRQLMKEWRKPTRDGD